MVRLLGFFLITCAAGCVTQPADREIPQEELREGLIPTAAVPCPPRGSLAPRIGLEFLPKNRARGILGHGGDEAPRRSWQPRRPLHRDPVDIEPLHVASEPAQSGGQEPEPSSDQPWTMTADELARVENPFERFTLQFLHHVLGEDRRRVRQSISAPILFGEAQRLNRSQAMRSHLDERDAEDQQLLLAREGRRLLNRPLRRALRDSTIVRDFELMFDDFKSENLPLSKSSDEVEKDDIDWGRISLRLRPTRTSDPGEVSYVRNGLRVGTGYRRFKTSYEIELAPRVLISLRSNYIYEDDRLELFGDLHWRFSADARLHILAGDRIDLLTGSTLYPLVHSPVVLQTVDESPGMMFYVEHMF